jgi:hypothetical protein
MQYGIPELILQNLQHKEIFCLLCLTVIQCLNSTEGNNDPSTAQAKGDVGIDGIKELDPGPIEDDDGFDSGDPENCANGTTCYDLVPSQLFLSDHSISAFQQRHQEFPLVKLKDDTYHSFSPMVLIHLDHTFAQYPDLHLHTILFDCCFWAILQATSIWSSTWGDIISMMSLPISTAF